MDSNCSVGLYIRSATMNDEGINAQKAILEKWCCDNGISNISVYTDNGYSGTNYNRPSFRKLLDDVECGKIGMVVTTDLSRIGRDLTLTNEYLSSLSSKARYVAVKDGIDSSLQPSIIEALIKVSAASGKRKKMDKNELTPMQIARRKYEEKNKEERKEKSAQFSTFIPRELYNEVNEFLKKHNISKVQLIFEGFEALKKQYEAQDKK